MLQMCGDGWSPGVGKVCSAGIGVCLSLSHVIVGFWLAVWEGKRGWIKVTAKALFCWIRDLNLHCEGTEMVKQHLQQGCLSLSFLQI